MMMKFPFHAVDATNWEIGPCKFGRWQSFGNLSVRGSKQNLRAEVEWHLKLEQRGASAGERDGDTQCDPVARRPAGHPKLQRRSDRTVRYDGAGRTDRHRRRLSRRGPSARGVTAPPNVRLAVKANTGPRVEEAIGCDDRSR